MNTDTAGTAATRLKCSGSDSIDFSDSPAEILYNSNEYCQESQLYSFLCMLTHHHWFEQALVAGGVATAVFHMPILLAFTLGFILKAVGPAIVIQLMFDLQRKGRGVDKGAPLIIFLWGFCVIFPPSLPLSSYAHNLELYTPQSIHLSLPAPAGPVSQVMVSPAVYVWTPCLSDSPNLSASQPAG